MEQEASSTETILLVLSTVACATSVSSVIFSMGIRESVDRIRDRIEMLRERLSRIDTATDDIRNSVSLNEEDDDEEWNINPPTEPGYVFMKRRAPSTDNAFILGYVSLNGDVLIPNAYNNFPVEASHFVYSTKKVELPSD